MRLMAVQVDQPKLKLRLDQLSFGRPPIPNHCVRQAVHYAFTARIQHAYPVRRFRVTKRVRSPPMIERLLISLALVGIDAALENATSNIHSALLPQFICCGWPDFVEHSEHGSSGHGSRIAWPIPRMKPLSR